MHLEGQVGERPEHAVAGLRQAETQFRASVQRAAERDRARLHGPRLHAQPGQHSVVAGHRPIVAPLACAVRVNFRLWFGPQSVGGLP